MIIREATKEDVPKILPVWREMVDFHAERDSIFNTCQDAEKVFEKYVCESIEKDEIFVLVAEVDSVIVGYCRCSVEQSPPGLVIKRYGKILELGIFEQYRRKGIGEQMAKQAMKWFRTQNLERAEVSMSVHNEISTQFWRKMGFQPYLETLCQAIDSLELA